MNILQINNFHYVRGGSERYYFELSKLLETNGHKVANFSTKNPLNDESVYSNYFGQEVGFTSEYSLTDKIKMALGMLHSFSNDKLVSRIVRDHNIEIAHAHNIYGRVSPSVIHTLKKMKVPVVLTLHDYKICCPIYTLYRNGEICTDCMTNGYLSVIKNRCTKGSISYSCLHWAEHTLHEALGYYKHDVSLFLCPSKFLMEMHAKAGISKNKLVHMPNFINEQNYDPKFDNKGYILFVGRLSAEKGCLTLIKAVKGLDVQLKIVGDGPEGANYRKFVHDEGITNVVFEGYKKDDELRKIFQESMFMVIPSEWYENGPMSILESFAYGKPVIGSAYGGIPEMVLDGETGYLYEPRNHVDLSEKISFMLKNPNKVIEMGRKARTLIEQKYSSSVHYSAIINVYNKLKNTK